MTEQQEALRFRNPVKQAGFAVIYHVLTLDQELSDGAFRLYALLLKYARQSEGCWPGIERLARDLGKSKPTIERRLGELVKRGLISREQRGLGRTAVTYIEDVEDVYNSNPDKNDEESSPIKNDEANPIKNDGASPVKNDGALAPSKMMGKEETEEEADNGGGVQTTNQDTTIDTLTDFGVSKRVARRLAGERSLDDVQAWIAYAERADGLRDPPAFVVAKLQDGEVPPISKDGDGEVDSKKKYLGGKYGHLIQH